jgi:hypothetical protein
MQQTMMDEGRHGRVALGYEADDDDDEKRSSSKAKKKLVVQKSRTAFRYTCCNGHQQNTSLPSLFALASILFNLQYLSLSAAIA